MISDLMVCQAYDQWQQLLRAELPLEEIRFADHILRQMSNEPIEVCRLAMQRAEMRGLIEYEVSLRSGWLTEKGRELLSTTEEPDE